MNSVEMLMDGQLVLGLMRLCEAANDFGRMANEKGLDTGARASVYATVLHDLFHPEDMDFTNLDDKIIDIIVALINSDAI